MSAPNKHASRFSIEVLGHVVEYLENQFGPITALDIPIRMDLVLADLRRKFEAKYGEPP